MAIIECVPNISEGRDADRVARCVAACRVHGVTVLNASSDASHHRSVITLIGDAAGLKEAVLGLCAEAYASIDLRSHQGEHPRMGAVDVVPFIPIDGVTMAECVALARDVGAAIADRFEVPVFLYEDAASVAARKNLEDVRRGEFEGLADKLTRDEWVPDFGPRRAHPSAGACIVGARMPLVAFNINLATTRLDVAKKIATAVRFSSGGLRFVKAMGIALDGRDAVQVSMNLTNYEKTPVFRVFDMVQREAARYGVSVLESEIVGLVPAGALLATAEHYLQLTGFSAQQVLENKVRSAT
ncbi:MAG: glutamate formimidoyltransferase [Acidobacteria bacterium]|jgi:glutamate formiminotransferase|nr:glutamate formimidoyltransferase [Acidobacteriota bacterium]